MKAFLVAPFAGVVSAGRMEISIKNVLRATLGELRRAGYEAFSAHEDEKWGEAWARPALCTPRDRDLVERADLVVAIPGPPTSGGVHIELGWASAAGKPMIVFLSEGWVPSQLVLGLPFISPTQLVRVQTLNEVPRQLRTILNGKELSVDAFYDAMAPTYDMFMRGDDERNAQLTALLDLGGQQYLDVGCGTGEVAARLAKAGKRVFALDCSREMVARVRKRGIADAIEGWAQSLPFADNLFDVIYSIRMGYAYMRGMDARLAAVRELWRCVRPGGWVLWDSPRTPKAEPASLRWPSREGIVRTDMFPVTVSEAIAPFKDCGFLVVEVRNGFVADTGTKRNRVVVIARRPLEDLQKEL